MISCPNCGKEMRELKQSVYPVICVSEYLPFTRQLYLCRGCDDTWQRTWYKNWKNEEVIEMVLKNSLKLTG